MVVTAFFGRTKSSSLTQKTTKNIMKIKKKKSKNNKKYYETKIKK